MIHTCVCVCVYLFAECFCAKLSRLDSFCRHAIAFRCSLRNHPETQNTHQTHTETRTHAESVCLVNRRISYNIYTAHNMYGKTLHEWCLNTCAPHRYSRTFCQWFLPFLRAGFLFALPYTLYIYLSYTLIYIYLHNTHKHMFATSRVYIFSFQDIF